MTPSALKHSIISANPESHFFDSKTMKFFGDTMANYGCKTTNVKTSGGVVECWELYRKKPVKNGLTTSTFFDKITFNKVRGE